MFQQMTTVTIMNLAHLGSRVGTCLVVVVGIGGVVAVLLGLLAMSNGFRTALMETAKPDRGLILRNGSNQEMVGWVSNEEFGVISAYAGFAILSPEIYVTINVPKLASGLAADVVGRGVSDSAFDLRKEVVIVEGRKFRPGTGEIIVGSGAVGQYRGLALGDVVMVRNAALVVVGHFTAGGTSVESEIWMDLAVSQDIFRRTGGSSVVRVKLLDATTADAIDAQLRSDPRLTATLVMEEVFFAGMAQARAGLIETFAYLIASIMALGSVVAALNTMYTAVGKRSLEIATLRALGFRPMCIVMSVVIEAMLLALAGALLGAGIVYVAFDGLTAATLNGSGSQTVFAFKLSFEMLVTGCVWALLLGLVGGSLPALRAARLPITQALRGG
ncbi:MAG: FtsX-like permease family protein [Gammaproteobacteria bacterium]|nr:FtsX-like permease family protein [Gammaproteobacteria bacterium]